jgi:hypothetical protein
MWPWEHLAFAYLLYSPLLRFAGYRPPQTDTALALLVASLLADLIDKPLAWVFGVLPAGRSLGHSVLFAVPLVVVVAGVFWALHRTAVGPAFGLGYLSHLAGDAIYPLLTEGDLEVGFLLWPLIPAESGSIDAVPHLLDLLGTYLTFLATPRGALYLLFDATLVTVAVVAWALDGAPGLDRLRRRPHR